ncbi:MAG: hypothetical protein U0R26_11970 [Solirubrobacterales bacterium]
MLCAYLAGAVFLGLLGNALFGAWWLDPIAALLIAAVAVREGSDLARRGLLRRTWTPGPPAAMTTVATKAPLRGASACREEHRRAPTSVDTTIDEPDQGIWEARGAPQH